MYIITEQSLKMSSWSLNITVKWDVYEWVIEHDFTWKGGVRLSELQVNALLCNDDGAKISKLVVSGVLRRVLHYRCNSMRRGVYWCKNSSVITENFLKSWKFHLESSIYQITGTGVFFCIVRQVVIFSVCLLHHFWFLYIILFVIKIQYFIVPSRRIFFVQEGA